MIAVIVAAGTIGAWVLLAVFRAGVRYGRRHTLAHPDVVRDVEDAARYRAALGYATSIARVIDADRARAERRANAPWS